MDGQTLRRMRTDFGVTQEALADALDVTPRTIQRWETQTTAQRAVNATRIGRAICALGKCNGDRAARYATAMVPDHVIKSVTHCPTVAHLTYGADLTLITISEGLRKYWPLIAHLIGSDTWPLLILETGKLMRANVALLEKLRHGEISGIKVVVSGFPINFMGIKEDGYWRATLTSPHPEFIRYDTKIIYPDEYDEDQGKVIVID